MGMAPAIRIEAPTRALLPNGLFSVLTLTTPADPHWQLGAEWQPLDCTPLKGIGDPDCDPATPTVGLPKVFDATLLDASATAFTVYGEFLCNPAGRGAAGIQDLANQRLAGGEQSVVEQALWTGDLGNTPSFDKSGATDLGTATGYEEAVALCEQFLGEAHAGQGVIHMTRYAASLLSQHLVPAASVVRTMLGTPVVAGGGYPNDGRMFVTGSLFGYRSEVFTSSTTPGDLLDRGSNAMYAVAERSYLVGFDPCPLGVVTVATGTP